MSVGALASANLALGYYSESKFGSLCVANQHSLDTDWSQIGNLETLIGSRALYTDHVLRTCEVRLLRRTFLWQSELMAKYEIMVLACQVGPYHLTLTQINTEMNCIAKNKYPESQTARHETQR